MKVPYLNKDSCVLRIFRIVLADSNFAVIGRRGPGRDSNRPTSGIVVTHVRILVNKHFPPARIDRLRVLDDLYPVVRGTGGESLIQINTSFDEA
jgi:hypothetical protein